MTPFNWIKAAPWIACAVLAVLLAAMTHQYLGKRDELVSWKATVKTLGDAAEKRVAAAKKEGEDNLQKVKAAHENQVPEIRRNAAAAYAAAHPQRVRYVNTGGGGLPDNPASVKVDDGAGAQCVPDDAFIADAAEDAAKVKAWQAWCILNQCPVE